MSDSLREALKACRNYIVSPLRMTRDEDEQERRNRLIAEADAALSAPQADAEPVTIGAAFLNLCEALGLQATPSAYLDAVAARQAILAAAPPSQSAQMRRALEVLHKHCHKAVFLSASTIPDNHERALLDRIAARIDAHFNIALSRADDGKESEGSPVNPDQGLASQHEYPDESRSGLNSSRNQSAPSEPAPPDRREAIARIIDPRAFGEDWSMRAPQLETDRDRALAKADAILALQRGGQ